MSDARIHDLGYRSYDGERAGLRWTMTSLGVHAIQRVLGLKRAARHKVLPVAVLLIAFVPALVYVGIAAIAPADLAEFVPEFGEYYGIIAVAIFLFASFVAPEALCTDRRTGMLALYLASPLNRTTYVISKVVAVATVLLAITMMPQIFLLLSYTLADIGPEGIDGFLEAFVRIIVAGVMVAAFYAALTAAISSLTPRRGIASASIVMTMLVPGIVASAILESTDVSNKVALMSLAGLPFRSAEYLLGEAATGAGERGLGSLSGALVLVVTLAVTAALSAFTWWRYQQIEVDR